MFTDTHCHIYKEYYNDIDKLLLECKNNNVGYFINSGSDTKSNEEVIDLISKYDCMYGSIGLHPEEALNYSEKDIQVIENNLSNPKIIAIGEIGLDYHYDKEHKEEQKKLFKLQLQIAEKHKIPVIIHSRNATEDTINILKQYNVKGTIHSFSGSFETAMIYIKMGFLLGVNGVVTFTNSNLKDTLLKINPKNIVLETDSPYLTPHPYRGTKNSPKNIKLIAEFLSNLYNISLEELQQITAKNITELYKIKQ